MRRSHVRFSFVLLVLLLMLVAWSGFLRQPSHLQTVRDRGELTIVTRISGDTYQQADNGPRGMEYDLARRFADRLGVKLNVKVAESVAAALNRVAAGNADLAAAGVGVTEERVARYRLTDPYMSVHPQLIYRAGTNPPDALTSPSMDSVAVGIDPSQLVYLQQARSGSLPALNWRTDAANADDLLYRVWSGETPFAIVDSNEVLLGRHFYPELRVAFDVGGAKPLAWAFSPGSDGSLYREAQAFFADIEKNGVLARLQERYYGHLGKFDYVGTRLFMRHVANRLPKYRNTFREEAEKHDLDWRLLAAIGYQESHWNPEAVSPTGVRGVMMLTRGTATQVGVDDRVDAYQSIRGGTTYFANVKQRIDEDVAEPVRTWFALAAYNVGLGHLRDARMLTRKQGGDPSSWLDVKQRLPLLSQPKWHKQTEHGYARGWEPVRYVENVRRYYELLTRITKPDLNGAGRYTDGGAPGERRRPLGMRLGDPVESAF